MIRALTLAALAVLVGSPACGQPSAAPAVTVRSLGPLPTSVQRLLTKVGQSETVKVPAGASPYEVVRARCGGSLTNDFLADVQQLNPNFQMSPVAVEREVELPPCVRVTKNASVRVLPGDKSVETITRRVLGVPANQIIPVCDQTSAKPAQFASCYLAADQAFAAVNGGKPIRPADLIPGKTITVPTITWPTTIPLKPGIDAHTVAAQITAALSTKGLQPEIDVAVLGPDLRIIGPLASTDLKVKGTSCAEDQSPTKPWPFDARAVAEALKTSRAIAMQRGFLSGPAIVRVADTGFNGIGTLFPSASLQSNKFERPGQPYDLDKNSYNADVYGFDADNRGDLEPYPDDPYRDHGTQVADMALGGARLRAEYPDVLSLVNLSFVKVYWKRLGPITVKDETIYQAMTHIKNHPDARVVNLSVGTNEANGMRMFVSTLRGAEQLNLLAVIAAGNDANNISQDPTFPAAYGGSGSGVAEYIITVGAAAPDGSIAPFSNFSRRRVDILAPGCRVPSSIGAAGSAYLHGTSIAAPIVAFVAANLHSLGIREMTRVKQRILVSADPNPVLEPYTRLGGITLNVERALSIYDDVLRVHGEERDAASTWRRPSGSLKVCESGESVNPARILSISTRRDGDKTLIRVLYAEFDEQLAEPITCVPSDADLRFVDKSGIERAVNLKDIAVFVPRYPFPN